RQLVDARDGCIADLPPAVLGEIGASLDQLPDRVSPFREEPITLGRSINLEVPERGGCSGHRRRFRPGGGATRVAERVGRVHREDQRFLPGIGEFDCDRRGDGGLPYPTLATDEGPPSPQRQLPDEHISFTNEKGGPWRPPVQP